MPDDGSEIRRLASPDTSTTSESPKAWRGILPLSPLRPFRHSADRPTRTKRTFPPACSAIRRSRFPRKNSETEVWPSTERTTISNSTGDRISHSEPATSLSKDGFTETAGRTTASSNFPPSPTGSDWRARASPSRHMWTRCRYTTDEPEDEKGNETSPSPRTNGRTSPSSETRA